MAHSNIASTKEKGVTLLLGTVTLLFIIPMIGLAVDVGFLYATKSKLQAAVDGAALAAARALSIGQTTASQAASAQANAVNWFYGNFPNGFYGTEHTVMGPNNVQVFDDPNNPNMRNVTVTATTQVDTFFMKWLHFDFTIVAAVGNATRRDAVIMMVLDRSGSMGPSCADLKSAAKLFTGQFAAGRDAIGLVSFSEGTFVHSPPTTNFQTTLGYTNGFGTGPGAIDTLNCNGGTGTAGAISIAYNELYKMGLSGALNVVMFETDGLPNTLSLNWWDSAANTAGLANLGAGNGGCTDATGKTVALGGFRTAGVIPSWTNGYSLQPRGAYPDVPAGIIGALFSNDPHQGPGFSALSGPWQAGAGSNNNSIKVAPAGCKFSASSSNVSDFAWIPTNDIYGNQLYPVNAYKPVALSGGYVDFSGTTSTKWTNFHNAALNATDNAAFRVRTNPTLPAYFFGVGLGGNNGDPPDYILMQRMANDPNGDNYNVPPLYQPCAQEAGCLTHADQPQGNFIFSADRTKLSQAFLSISSQILRLSK